MTRDTLNTPPRIERTDVELRAPTHVTIPMPMHSPRARGIAALRGPHAHGSLSNIIPVRLSQAEYDAIHDACTRMDMSRSEFIRWCAAYTAKAIKRM
jgi:hypothetical protein